MNLDLTERLKATLWREYGGRFYAEWSEHKITQRYWEYLRTIDLLGLSENSVVLDIGGGGTGFFALILSRFVREVHVMDEHKPDHRQTETVWHAGLAAYDSLKRVLARNKQITHISCVSVFEHAPEAQRIGIIKAIDEEFTGDVFVTSLEFHPKTISFGYQLTTQTMSDMFREFTRFYPDVIESAPLECINAFKQTIDDAQVPMWKPIVMRFKRGW